MQQVREEFIIEAYRNACDEWKEKIRKEFPKLNLGFYNKEKVYIYDGGDGDYYKLHKLGSETKYGWIDLETSYCFANGYFDTAIKALDYVSGRKVYEANSLTDFFKGVYEEVKF